MWHCAEDFDMWTLNLNLLCKKRKKKNKLKLTTHCMQPGFLRSCVKNCRGLRLTACSGTTIRRAKRWMCKMYKHIAHIWALPDHSLALNPSVLNFLHCNCGWCRSLWCRFPLQISKKKQNIMIQSDLDDAHNPCRGYWNCLYKKYKI